MERAMFHTHTHTPMIAYEIVIVKKISWEGGLCRRLLRLRGKRYRRTYDVFVTTRTGFSTCECVCVFVVKLHEKAEKHKTHSLMTTFQFNSNHDNCIVKIH